MGVIAEECPCITGGMGIGEYLAHTLDKAVSVGIVTEDQSPLDAADNNVVKHTFSIETGMTGHGESYQQEKGYVKS